MPDSGKNPVDLIKKAALDAVAASKPTEIRFGTVLSASPLKIQLNQKLILSENQVILTRNVTDYEIDMAVSHTTEMALENGGSHSHGYTGTTDSAGEHTHEASGSEATITVQPNGIHSHSYSGGTETVTLTGLLHNHQYSGVKKYKVHNALVSGDKVALLRLQGGKRFLVLDRIAPIPTLEGEWL